MKLSKILVSKKTASCINEMYRRSEAERKIRMLGQKRVRLFAVSLLISAMTAVPVTVIDAGSASRPVTALERNGYGKGDRTVTLRTGTEGSETKKVTVRVSEKQYSDEEITTYSKKLDEVLWKTVLEDNPNSENVCTDLNLSDHIEGFPFSIEWTSDKPLLVGRGGVINTDRLKEEDDGKGVMVRLCASVKYKGYTEDKYSFVVLKCPEGDDKGIGEMIEESIKTSDEMSCKEDEQLLPDSVSGKKIIFYEDSVNRGPVIFVLGLIPAAFLIAKKDDEIRNKAKYRRKQIEADHSRIVNQYALYHTAGMNPRAIWYKICNGYELRLMESGQNKRYAYEEMLITRKMMDDGVGELAAYDDHAQRIGSIRFRSFINLIKQAVVKGGTGLTEALYEETEKARRDRMSAIRNEASEAQTKLLLPMFMMLLVVLVTVMVPAFVGLDG